MKVSILSPNLSSNELGRAYGLGLMLKSKYEVEIVGPLVGPHIWASHRQDTDIPIKPARLRHLPARVDGDIVLASKPLLASFGVGLLKKVVRKRPLILDIDDWQLGMVKSYYARLSRAAKAFRLAGDVVGIAHNFSYWNNWLCEQLVFLADQVVVSNRWLQRKFGGIIIWHPRRADMFDPARYDRDRVRHEYHLSPDDRIVMFSGTPRPHKGVGELIEAVAGIDDGRIKLVVVGLVADHYSRHFKKMGAEKLGNRFIGIDMVPFHQVPRWLACADLVVLPQKIDPAALGQIPAKVFDAMAMAKPIVSTDVCDLGEILQGCGWVIKPDQLGDLTQIIMEVLSNPDRARQMGQQARQRFLGHYSFQQMEKRLLQLMKQYD